VLVGFGVVCGLGVPCAPGEPDGDADGEALGAKPQICQLKRP
jgi:hypothetical protein